jgi:two-component system, LytTR family, sensor kinase
MDAQPNRSRSHRWIWIASIWLGFGLIDATQTVVMMHAEGMHHPWSKLFLTSVLEWLPWAVATPFIMRLGQRFPPQALRAPRAWLPHLAACATVGVAFSGWASLLNVLLHPYDKSPLGPFHVLWLHNFTGGILSFLVIYAAVLAVSYSLDSAARLARQQTETARLNEQLSKAQLNALRHQIEPHFLFNTLNSVSALVRENRNDAAVTMIARLSDLLRRVLDDSGRQQAPLAEEMEFAGRYLDIQKVRFVDRLQLSVDIPAELLPARVPTLVLQLMVENAIKHGIAKRAQGGAIRIAAARNNGTLTLSVYNDGPALPLNFNALQSGIGISNMRTRLEGLYGDAFTLNMQNRPPGGVEVSVSVPFHE